MEAKAKKIVRNTIVTVFALVVIGIIIFRTSPWPRALLTRYLFNSEAEKVSKKLERFIPANINSIGDLHYDPSDEDAFLNAYFPTTGDTNARFPVIVWIHGGGLISGNKDQVSNYCKILSSKGFVTISIDYTIAPEGKYPTPLRQTNAALKFINENAEKLKADTSFFVLAGDSGGSMIAAQVANIIYNREYANLVRVQPGIRSEKLRGLLLYCGIYNIKDIELEGQFGAFMQNVFWSYLGKKDISGDPYAITASVYHYIDNRFPPSFISAGNGDPLLSQSLSLSRKLTGMGLTVDSLFFAGNLKPALPHEYQFALHTDAGQLAFDRSISFLTKLKGMK